MLFQRSTVYFSRHLAAKNPTGFIRTLKYITPTKSHLKDLLEEMPKTSNVASELRHIRIKHKAAANKQARQSPGSVYLSFLGNGGKGNPRCVYMFSDHYSYIFNCGEGTQRLAHEHKMKLTKLEQVFITHGSWKNIGGLLGLSLTIRDIGVPEISIHGPPEISQIYDITRPFSTLKTLKVISNDITNTFSDECMSVKYAILFSKTQTAYHRAVMDVMEPSNKSDDDSDESEQIIQNKRIKLSPENNDISVAYICKLHNKPGELLVSKCVEMGVPPGPLLGKLKSGRDVTLKDGRVVKSSDVVAPEEPGPVFIVVECPNEDYLESLIQKEDFKKHQKESDDPASLVIHFTPPEIIRHPHYQDWIKRFGRGTSHLIANSDSASLSSVGVHEIQEKLNYVDPDIFPTLQEVPAVTCDETDAMTLQASSSLRYHLRPPSGPDLHCVPLLTSNLESLKQTHGLEEVYREMQNQIKDVKILDDFDREYPEVLFLGTGSAIPSTSRNVTAIIVNTSPNTSILLDCGEGTYKQIIRFYGPERTESLLSNLNAIFVSHLHVDHHIGLVQLLLEREKVLKKTQKYCPKLRLIAPMQIKSYLESYHNTFEPVAHLFHLVPNYILQNGKRRISEKDYEYLKNQLNMKEIATSLVHHCSNAYGLTFTTNCNFKIVYSGDTMPCERLIKAGQNCHLLIHEATMNDDMLEDAILKTHSTTSQAIEVGHKMKAKFTILTHFSQRYSKLPPYNGDFLPNVGFAYDNLILKPKDLFKLPLFVPVLKTIFKDECEEINKRTFKRQQKKELIAKMTA